jgi:hypothetical protein
MLDNTHPRMALSLLLARTQLNPHGQPPSTDMKQLPTILKSFCAVASLSLALNAQAQVTNGGFETGNFSGWTLTPPAGPNTGQQFSNVGSDPAFAQSGTYHANLAPDVNTTGTLSQVMATTAGTAYTLSFWLANNSAVPTNFFTATINGVIVFTTASPPFPISGQYQQIFANFTATSASTTLAFNYRHDDDFWRLDDVAVSRNVPEGGAPLWLALPVLGGLCLVHFRTRRAAQV